MPEVPMPSPDQPASDQPPTAAGSSTDATSTDVLASLDITQPMLVRSLRVGALAYVAAWVAGLVSIALAFFTAILEDGTDELSWSWLLTGPAQLVAMAFRSPAVMTVSSDGEDFGFAASVSVTASLITVGAVAIVAMVMLTRRDEKAEVTPTTKGAISLAIASAVTFVAIGMLLALVLKPSFTDGTDTTTFGAGGIRLVLVGGIVMAAAGILARRPWRHWSVAASVPPAVHVASRALVVHLLVFTVLVIPVGVVWVITEGQASTVPLLPAVLGNALIFALTIGHFGALEVGGVGSFFGESTSGSEQLYVFTDGGTFFMWLTVPIAILATLAAAVVIHRRNAGRTPMASDWVWAGVVFGGAGGVATYLSTLSSDIGSSFGAGGSASFGPASWFLLLFAGWGLLAMAAAGFVGPVLTQALPQQWVKKASGE